jgi:sugar (pentulose or hexulose) kinase
MSTPRFIAVLDAGRTNIKFAVIDLASRSEIVTATKPNRVLVDGPYPHFDVEATWSFFAEQMRANAAAGHRIDGIAVSAHGSCMAVIGEEDLALPVLDYEHDGPDELAAAYDAVRPDFADTLSPRLPKGFNAGAQLFWLQQRFPDAFAGASAIVTYPQYWLWRMTGVVSNEITSVGCHTDLWDNRRGQWSVLAESQGWVGKLAPLHAATRSLGMLREELASDWGLPAPIVVAGGLHDSNASLVPHLIDREPPFTVISTGTWAISFGVGATPAALDERRDTLANINIFGGPVPAARFKGGRELSIATEGDVIAVDPATLSAVLDKQVMLLPSVTPDSGPFPNVEATWLPAGSGITPAERFCAASLYLALMSATCLDLIAARGPTIIDGPFSDNPIYRDALATLTGRDVVWSQNHMIGPCLGAALLFDIQGGVSRKPTAAFATAAGLTGAQEAAFAGYRARWRDEAEARLRRSRQHGARAGVPAH